MPPVLLYTLGVLIFAFGLLASIALHEIGHLIPAKKFGVKVTQYMVGFGPTLWSRHRGDTEYGVKAIPLGGYIRMIGMVPPRPDGKVSRWPRRMATAIEDFRQVSRAEVQPGDEDRQFYRLTPGKKMIIMLGGPCMNLLIFLVLSVLLFLTIGAPHDDVTNRVASVEKKVACVDPTRAAKDACPATPVTAPAYGKLRPGDRIMAVNGVQIASWNQLVKIIEKSAGKHLTVAVDRDGVTQLISITPVRNVKYVDDSLTKTKVAGFLGVSAVVHHYYSPLSITQVPGQIGSQLSLGVRALGSYPSKLENLYQTVFDGQKRDPNGAVGVVGIGRISGDFARSTALTAQDKFYALVSLLAGVNLLLFFFNLLPLLPLDGGHVAGAIVEAMRRGWARLRGRRRLIFV
ncbi:MAG TPA: site-2 protease family protein, partial [Jatrophihabitans sp.]|nr:site-2 protease family protein [Jatrophihabitans sp.]